MDYRQPYWEHVILDADPPVADAGGLAVGDIDGDGHDEVVVGGAGALLWYRPDGSDRGVIAEGEFAVGLAIGDIDGDGRPEIVAAERDGATSTHMITWFRRPADGRGAWERHALDPQRPGSAHDILILDIDADGRPEVLANATGTDPGVFLYRPGDDVGAPWERHTVSRGHFAEGLSAGDLTGDGLIEIVHGPDWFVVPPGGPFAGAWERRVYAPDLREMTRTAIVDVSGDGMADIIVVESEYLDGRLAWYEHRATEQGDILWYEHRLEDRLIFAHSLQAWRDDSGAAHIFLAEMAKGGWDAPYNHDARLIRYTTPDGGATWQRDLLSQGAGTHEAVMRDVDGDGRPEVVGKEWGRALGIPKVHLWRELDELPALERFRHRLLDRDKPLAGSDILAADLDGDDRADLVCGAWWYRNGLWERREIPGVEQVIGAYDLDGDGAEELIATGPPPGGEATPGRLGNHLIWLKPLIAEEGQWERHEIGTGSGDWPHGSAVAPLLPGGRLALVVGYHSASRGHQPEMFEVPEDPREGPWRRRTLAEIPYGEELLPYDLTGNGLLDIVAGPYWLENLGDGTFATHETVTGFKVARLGVMDVNGNGRPDIVLGEEVLDFEHQVTPWSRVAWLEHPEDPRVGPWRVHVIDKVRCPHSLDVADLDGDGELEIVVGEHDPFKPYRSRCRLLVYKKANAQGMTWRRHVVDDRFEHHDGAQVVDLGEEQWGIASHGWKDSRYVHLWVPL